TSKITPSTDPCAVGVTSQSYTISRHHSNRNNRGNGGFLDRFLQFIQGFLDWILKALGINTSPTTEPTQGIEPTQPIEPTQGIEPTQWIEPTNSPCVPTPTNITPTP